MSSNMSSCGSRRDGRVLDDDGNVNAGLFVSGWLRRGPTGIIGAFATCIVSLPNLLVHAEPYQRAEQLESIDNNCCAGTNIPDAEIVAEAVAADLRLAKPKLMFADIQNVLDAAGVPVFTFEDWQALDAEEVRRGQLVGKPREKMTFVQDMLPMRNTV